MPPTTIGKTLKEARLEKQLSLEQVVKATRIRMHYLEALENDRRSDIPSLTQGKGFLRLYADFLGLPVQPLLDAWDRPSLELTAVVELMVEPIPPPTTDITPPPIVDAPPSLPDSNPVPPSEDTRPIPIKPISNSPYTPAMIWQEIGVNLREQREKLGLSLADIEQYTHVKIHYLEAIEAGLFDNLPSPVQCRGMLSNYAAFLSMDSDAILLRFADGLQARHGLIQSKPVEIDPQTHRPIRKNVLRRFLTPDLVILGGLILVFLVVAFWITRQMVLSNNLQANATIPAIAEVLLNPSQASSQDALSLTPISALSGGSTPVPSAISVAENPATATPPPNDSPLQVYVVSRLRTYLKVTADGEVIFIGRTIPGNAYPFYGSRQIDLETGNAAALQVIFNQNDLGTLGIMGQAIKMTFDLNGVLIPTSIYTMTPTVTPQPT